MDLIDRQVAIDALLELVEARRTWKNTENARKEISGIDASMCAIHDLPSVDAVEVVRCNDCKWFNKIGCAINIVDESDKPHEDDFCSFAERRTDE